MTQVDAIFDIEYPSTITEMDQLAELLESILGCPKCFISASMDGPWYSFHYENEASLRLKLNADDHSGGREFVNGGPYLLGIITEPHTLLRIQEILDNSEIRVKKLWSNDQQ